MQVCSSRGKDIPGVDCGFRARRNGGEISTWMCPETLMKAALEYPHERA
jgi:hypothetical protein